MSGLGSVVVKQASLSGGIRTVSADIEYRITENDETAVVIMKYYYEKQGDDNCRVKVYIDAPPYSQTVFDTGRGTLAAKSPGEEALEKPINGTILNTLMNIPAPFSMLGPESLITELRLYASADAAARPGLPDLASSSYTAGRAVFSLNISGGTAVITIDRPADEAGDDDSGQVMNLVDELAINRAVKMTEKINMLTGLIEERKMTDASGQTVNHIKAAETSAVRYTAADGSEKEAVYISRYDVYGERAPGKMENGTVVIKNIVINNPVNTGFN